MWHGRIQHFSGLPVLAALVFFGGWARVSAQGGDRLELSRADSEGAMPEGAALRSEELVTHSKSIRPAVVSKARLGRNDIGTPIYRNEVPYYPGWTIRAGVMRLKLPANRHWRLVDPSSDFYRSQADTGATGDYLAAVLYSRGFMQLAKTKYVSYFSLIWIPRQYAFKEMDRVSFAVFKVVLQEESVAERKLKVDRLNFSNFEDYLNFKFGRDEEVSCFVDGFMIRAVEEDDLVMYFATSEFLYKGPRAEVVEPLILTVTYALVHGKLIRVDTKRLYRTREDISSLVTSSQIFIQDMRHLNVHRPMKR